MTDKTLSKNSWHYRMYKRVTGGDDTQGIRKCDYWGNICGGLFYIAAGVVMMAATGVLLLDIWYFEDAARDLGGKVMLTILTAVLMACGFTVAILPTGLFVKVEESLVKISERIGRALRCNETLTFTD
jgi:cytochrome b subunit of formate dehydrogenase